MESHYLNRAIISMSMVLYTCQAVTNLHPLILIPGSGGNQLEARLSKDYDPSSFWCRRWLRSWNDEKGWFRLWFDPIVLVDPYTKCFADRMMLRYDEDLDDYRNTRGVETRVTHFGTTQSLLYLNPFIKQLTAYMAPLVQSIEKIGYRNGKTLFGAPYDFRYGLAADGHPSKVGSKFLQDLKNLIEKASISNGGKPVILVSHSLGGLFTLQLLNRNPTSWRKKYIKHFVALSAPWGGTVDAMLTFASGNALGVPIVNPLHVREEQRSSESNMWLLPFPKLFGDETLVTTPNATYSANNIAQFLTDIGFARGVYPYKSRILPLTEEWIAPEVPITCIIGSGVKTVERLEYGESFDKRPEVLYGDGDGTVNMVSLLALEDSWGDNKNQSIRVIRVDGVAHTSILADNVALDEIVRELSVINS